MNPSHLFAPHRSSPSTGILMENKCDHLITQPHLRQCYEYVNWVLIRHNLRKYQLNGPTKVFQEVQEVQEVQCSVSL